MIYFVDRLLGFPFGWVLVLIFVVLVVEALIFVGFFFPGEIAILFGGVFANEGWLLLWSVILVGILGSMTSSRCWWSCSSMVWSRWMSRGRWFVWYCCGTILDRLV